MIKKDPFALNNITPPILNYKPTYINIDKYIKGAIQYNKLESHKNKVYVMNKFLRNYDNLNNFKTMLIKSFITDQLEKKV